MAKLKIKSYGLCLVVLNLFCNFAMAQSAKEFFNSGLRQYSAGQIQESAASFGNALRLDPENADILANLGINFSALKEYGRSIAYLKSALALQPDHFTAKQALEFTIKQLEVTEIPHKVSYWETFRNSILSEVSLPFLLVFFALVVFLFFWRFLELVKVRRTARLTDSAPPNISFVIYLAGFVLALNLLVLVAKLFDLSEQRGIILPKKIAVLSGPAEDSVQLFDLYEGLEVAVKRQDRGWTQVTYPGGSSGWVPASAIQYIQRIYNP